jgi:hypothetical protein
MKIRLLLALALALTATACGKKNGHKNNAATPAAAAALPVLANPLDDKSVLVIGNKYLAATKIQAAGEGAPEPGLAAFSTELYPKLRDNCGPGCHAVNAYPFASDGAPLAFQTAKKYMTANPDDSKMIQNIKSGHNGVKPDLAADFSAAIAKVAAAMAAKN